MINILLTGASGNIGFFLYSVLNDEYEIIPTSKSGHSKNEFTKLDLIDLKSINEFVKTILQLDSLIFLVGLAHKKGKGKDIDEFSRINKQTLVNLLSSLDKLNKLPSKIIFASTISVYGENINQSVYTEDNETLPFSPYAVTKYEAEDFLLNNFSDQSWILRFAPVYSKHFKVNINRRTKSVGLNYKVGNGNNKLSLCNIENISVAVKGILEDKVPAGIYNISDNKEYSYNELLNYVSAKWVLPIPNLFFKGIYFLGSIMGNSYLKENATKLVSDNIFPSDKIRNFIDLHYTLDDVSEKN